MTPSGGSSEVAGGNSDVAASISAEPIHFRSRQSRTLLARELRLLAANRGALLSIVALPIVIGGALRLAVQGAGDATLLAFLAVITIIWTVMSHAALAIVGERTIHRRETHVGLNRSAYLASKFWLVTLIAIVQAILLAAVIRYLPGQELSNSAAVGVADTPGQVAVLVGVLALCGVAGGALGLLISAISPTKEVANALVPLAVIFQLLFSAPIVESGKADLSDVYDSRFTMSDGSPAVLLSYATISRWGDMALRTRMIGGELEPSDGKPFVATWLPALLAAAIIPLALAWLALQMQGRTRTTIPPKQAILGQAR